MENEIVASLEKWLEEQEPKNPIYDMYAALVDGTATYREYLKLIGKVVTHFCDDLGFVPDSNLVRIIQDKIYHECSDNNTSRIVQTITNGINSLQSIEDDYL